jgi:hypothetical protein
MSDARLAMLLLLRMALLAVTLGGLSFGSAASWRYWQAWAYLGVFLGSSMAIGVYFLVRDPAFLERRMRWRETERSQKIGQSAMALLSIIAYVVPGLDHRYGWSQVPRPGPSACMTASFRACRALAPAMTRPAGSGCPRPRPDSERLLSATSKTRLDLVR